MLTVDAGVHCVILPIEINFIRCGCFARCKVFLKTHSILSYQGLVGLTQLNFNTRLFVIEAFNFVFYLALISKDRFLSFYILLPFS